MSADAAPYPLHWEADVVLADGGTVHIRPITPDDAAGLEALHARLSERTIHYRFFSPRPRLSARDVERFTVVDHDDRVALVALLGDDMIAVARYDRVPGTDEAEAAFVVEDAHQGRGLGTLLLEHLAAAARERGISRFVAEVLPDNRRMLGVFRDAGWQVASSWEAGVVHVTFAIDPTEEALAAQQAREHRAEAQSMARLLAPASIVVIGASRTPGSVGHTVLRNLLEGGFAGPVYPVNPDAPHVASVRAYASVLDVPDDVDLAVIAVPAEAVGGVVDECARKRVRGLVVLSTGFGDAGDAGAAAERELVAHARRCGMRVIGPASMGVVNTDPAVSMNASLSSTPMVAGGLAFSSQSGALGIALLEWAERLGLGVSTFVSVGNKADVSGNDLLQYWEDDDATEVVLFYTESFGNPRKFARVARRVARRKPIVAVKSGRGSSPRDAIVDALYRQTGVVRVDTLEQLFDMAMVLAGQPLPAGRRVAVVAATGGPGLLAADACEGAGLQVVDLPGGNPVVMPAEAAASDYEEAVRLRLSDQAVDAVLVIFTPPMRDRAPVVGESMAVAARQAGKPVVATFLSPDGGLGRLGRLPTYRSPEAAALALARAATYAEWRARPQGELPDLDRVDVGALRLLVDTVVAEAPEGCELGGADAAQLLAHVGIDVALALADKPGPPAGGDGALAAAPGPGEVETVVGVTHDPLFGPLVTLAIGGRVRRLLDDEVSRVTPLFDVDAADLVRSLRSAPILFGEGEPRPDVAALQDVLLRVGRLVDEVPELAELDLDPVVVSPAGAVVTGARVRLAAWEARPELALRRLR